MGFLGLLNRDKLYTKGFIVPWAVYIPWSVFTFNLSMSQYEDHNPLIFESPGQDACLGRRHLLWSLPPLDCYDPRLGLSYYNSNLGLVWGLNPLFLGLSITLSHSDKQRRYWFLSSTMKHLIKISQGIVSSTFKIPCCVNTSTLVELITKQELYHLSNLDWQEINSIDRRLTPCRFAVKVARF